MNNNNNLSKMILLFFIVVIISCKFKRSFLSYNFTILSIEPESNSQVFLQFISDIQLCIGTPFSCKTIQFVPNTYQTALLDINGEKKALLSTTLDKQSSSSFKLLFDYWNGFFYEIIYKARHSADKISFGSLELEEFEFFLAYNWSSELKYSIIGLSVDFRQNIFPSFIKQLVNNHIIETRQYSIEFYNETKGRVFFGSDSSTIQSNAFELKLTDIHSPIIHYYRVSRVYIGKEENVLAENIEITFDEAFGFIQMSYEMKTAVIENYLIDLKCYEESMTLDLFKSQNTTYSQFICDKQQIANKFHSKKSTELVFDFKEGRLSLGKEDFFSEYNKNRMRFIIIIAENNVNPQWIIGWPLLKKHIITHNYDNRTISFQYAQKTTEPSAIPSFPKEYHLTANVLITVSVVLLIGILINVISSFKEKLIRRKI